MCADNSHSHTPESTSKPNFLPKVIRAAVNGCIRNCDHICYDFQSRQPSEVLPKRGPLPSQISLPKLYRKRALEKLNCSSNTCKNHQTTNNTHANHQTAKSEQPTNKKRHYEGQVVAPSYCQKPDWFCLLLLFVFEYVV